MIQNPMHVSLHIHSCSTGHSSRSDVRGCFKVWYLLITTPTRKTWLDVISASFTGTASDTRASWNFDGKKIVNGHLTALKTKSLIISWKKYQEQKSTIYLFTSEVFIQTKK